MQHEFLVHVCPAIRNVPCLHSATGREQEAERTEDWTALRRLHAWAGVRGQRREQSTGDQQYDRTAHTVGRRRGMADLFTILDPGSAFAHHFFKTGVRVACAASFFSETAETEPVKLELVSSKRRTRINSKISVEIVYVHMFTCSYEHLFVIIDGVRVYEHQLLERCSRGLRTRMVDPKRLQSRYRQNVRTRKSATQQVDLPPPPTPPSPTPGASNNCFRPT